MATRRQGHLKEISPGKWCIRVTIGVDAGNKTVRLNKTFHGTKAQAQKYLTAALKRRDDGYNVVLTRQSLGAWIEEWLGVWCGGISARTKSDYDRLLKRYLTPELRCRQLPLITATEIQAWVNSLSSRGLAPRTVLMAHGSVRACLNRAARVGKIPRNVATLVELPRKTHTERLYLGPQQATQLIYACSREEWGAFFIILIMTGIRPGEAFGLQWSDLDGNVLRVRRALVQVARQKFSDFSADLAKHVALRGRASFKSPEHKAKMQYKKRESHLTNRLQANLGRKYNDEQLRAATRRCAMSSFR